MKEEQNEPLVQYNHPPVRGGIGKHAVFWFLAGMVVLILTCKLFEYAHASKIGRPAATGVRTSAPTT